MRKTVTAADSTTLKIQSYAAVTGCKLTREYSCFLGHLNRPAVLGVERYELLNPLDMGGPDDDLRSAPVVGGFS